MRSRLVIALAGQRTGDASGFSVEIFTGPRVRRKTHELSMRTHDEPSSSKGAEHASAGEYLAEMAQTAVRFPY